VIRPAENICAKLRDVSDESALIFSRRLADKGRLGCSGGDVARWGVEIVLISGIGFAR